MRRILCVSLGVFLLLGCTSKGKKPVSGTLTYKGQPVPNVMLRLIPASGGATSIPIAVDQQGKFSTTGIAPGEYTVILEKGGGSGSPAGRGRPEMSTKGMDPEKAAKMKAFEEKMKQEHGDFPAKYTQAQTSDLKLTISETGNPNAQLELKD